MNNDHIKTQRREVRSSSALMAVARFGVKCMFLEDVDVVFP